MLGKLLIQMGEHTGADLSLYKVEGTPGGIAESIESVSLGGKSGTAKPSSELAQTSRGIAIKSGTASTGKVQYANSLNCDPNTDQIISQPEFTVDWVDLKEHLRALPTKNDIQLLITAVETSCKQAVEGLREHIGALGHRVEEMETGQEAIRQAVVDVQDITKNHEEVLNSLLDQMDNHENRDCRQNIHIRDLPEIKQHTELFPKVISLFQSILGTSASDKIEIDRVHRALLPTPPKCRETKRCHL